MAKLSRATLALLAMLLAVGAVLYLAVFDVWVVPDGAPATAALEPGDVVLVGRRSEPTKDSLVRCSDPRTQAVVAGRFSALAGERVAATNGKAAGVEPGHVVVRKESQAEPAESLSLGRRASPAPPRKAPAAVASAPAAPASVEAGEMLPGQTCRRVVYRLWGRQGPFSEARRFSPIY